MTRELLETVSMNFSERHMRKLVVLSLPTLIQGDPGFNLIK